MRRSAVVIAAFLVPAFVVAQGSICDPCVDGPEMVMPRRQKAAAPVEVIRCETGSVQRTFGGTDWLVSECDNGWLQVVAMHENPVSPYFFTFRPVGSTYELIDGRPRGRFARAAYTELLSLTGAEINELLLEVRASVN